VQTNLLLIIALLITLSSSIKAGVHNISLAKATLKPIHFSNTPKTKYQIAAAGLKITVEKSASALIIPFQKIHRLTGVSFQWYALGKISGASEETERSKKGDDALIRIGLIISGPKPIVPIFAPDWIKKVQTTLHLPSNRMIYLTPGMKNSAGTKFEHPYSSSIEVWSVASTPVGVPWNKVAVEFPQLNVVGLWIMADGDNSGSDFVTHLKKLQLYSKDQLK